MRSLVAILCLLILPLPLFAEEEPGSAPDWGFTEIDQITLGEQIVGDPVSHHDLRGRVVLLYQWGITCPRATGAFPAVNRIVAEYRERGLVVVGFQVRRNPDVLAENVQYSLNFLRPDFPVFRLGDDWDWPARSLPWGLLYDHTGKKIYGGNLGGIGKRIEAALAEAGDPRIGGPYTELADLAAKMAFDSDHLGTRLAEVRKLAAATDETPKRAEARALLARVTLWHGWRMAKADEADLSPVELAKIYQDLAARFQGDPLAESPAGKLESITGAKGYADEVAAHGDLAQARYVLRYLPPAGQYAYNMDYTESDDADLKAGRARMITELRAALGEIVAKYPKTWAAGQARDLRFLHDAPFLETEAAAKCLERAKKLVDNGTTPVELYDARLLLEQIREGHFEEDEIAAGAGKLRAAIEKRAVEFPEAGSLHRSCNVAEADLRFRVQMGGSALLRVDADKFIAMLEANAKTAGKVSRVAQRTRSFVEALERSYAGPANFGVVFDTRRTAPGAGVRYVYPRSAAARAEFRMGDVIFAIDEKKIASATDVDTVLEEKKPGDLVKVFIRRLQNDVTLEVTIEVVLGRDVR